MKHFIAALVIAGMIAVSSGCSASNGNVNNTPFPTIIETQSPSLSPVVTVLPTVTAATPTLVVTPSPTVTPPNVYVSEKFGFSFTVPNSWVGKYHVKEGEGYLTVYFDPAEPTEYGNSELFSIGTEAYAEEELFDSDYKFEINGVVFIWGSISILYTESDPEYDTYMAWQKDIPGVFKSIRSLSGQEPENVKKLWIEVIPHKQVYTSTNLGISFTLPKDWLGSCCVVEDEGYLSVYFKPQNPIAEDMGDGLLFIIVNKKLNYDWDLFSERKDVTVKGVTFVCGGPTDVGYGGEGKELDRYIVMENEICKIFKTVRAAK